MIRQHDTVRPMSPNLPVVYVAAGGGQCGDRASTSRTSAALTFSAHLLGEGAGRRGLKGGAPLLQAAQRAYLEAEWSGGADRRSASGCVTLKRI